MVDLFIVILYLIITLTVGYLAGRKVRNMKEFSISDRAFPTTVLVSTIFATWMGGDDLIGVSERVYTVGLIFFVIQVGQTVSLFIHGYIIAPKILRDFSDKISIGEIMGSLYGKYGQIMSGIANIFFSIGYIAIQVSSIGYVCNLFFEIPHFYGTIIGSIIVISYSAFGGIRSVVFTDVLQFGVLIIGIPLMASVALDQVGGWGYLVTHLPAEHLNVGPSHESFGLFMVFFVIYAFPFFSPMVMQRILMAKSIQQAKQSLSISGALYMPFYAVITIISLCAVVMFPNIEPNKAFLSILDHSLPPIVKGIAVSGVLAVIMSTADSFLNVSTIAAARDVMKVIWPEKIDDRNELLFSRIMTVVLGFSSIYIATMFDHMIDFWLYFSNFWAPTVAAPMLLYMCGYRTNVKNYLFSIAVGFAAIVAYRYLTPDEYDFASQMIGLFATFISMTLVKKEKEPSVSLATC